MLKYVFYLGNSFVDIPGNQIQRQTEELLERKAFVWKCNCLDIRATTVMNEVLLEWAHSMAEGIQLKHFEGSVRS